MNALIPLVWFAALAALFFVLVVLPQRRKMQAFYAMQASVQVGDEILTTSGLHGTVRALGDEDLDLEIAPGVVVRFARQAIGRILSEPSEPSQSGTPGEPAESSEHDELDLTAELGPGEGAHSDDASTVDPTGADAEPRP